MVFCVIAAAPSGNRAYAEQRWIVSGCSRTASDVRGLRENSRRDNIIRGSAAEPIERVDAVPERADDAHDVASIAQSKKRCECATFDCERSGTLRIGTGC